MGIEFRKLQEKVAMEGTFGFLKERGYLDYGWYDWWCEDEELERRTKAFFPLILGIHKGGKVDFSWDAWFKNNCPAWSDDLYDDFRLTSTGEDGVNEFVIAHNEPGTEESPREEWTVYCPANDYREPTAEFKWVGDLVDWLNEPWKARGGRKEDSLSDAERRSKAASKALNTGSGNRADDNRYREEFVR